ncbi:MAG: hypothetical protein V4525_04595 [Pseudomonadota bacterium]
MYFGATPWSGVRRVVIAANSEDVEELTDFDEGPMIKNWHQQLEERGIEVIEGLLRKDARSVLVYLFNWDYLQWTPWTYL